MTMLAEIVDVVIGVDTHKHTHSAAALSAGTAGVLEERTVAANASGYKALVGLADRLPKRRAWAIEGTGSYGAGLTRFSRSEVSRLSSSTVRGGRDVEIQPRATRSTPCGPPGRLSAGSTRPNPAPERGERPWPCSSPPVAPRSRPPLTPSISSPA